ncbi:hypothetical protein HK100_010119 [Physocladia obscura]|uniref:F-box domain-containing protein n=1 Tax=Physocladia obscura TaxID=109957 RepID=A0AAD5T2S7_9FUNG|nr:hypothetical protein HK100_010119 [Physocladia obscura]
METLPVELHLQITGWLRNPRDLARFTASCRQLQSLWFSEEVWRRLVLDVVSSSDNHVLSAEYNRINSKTSKNNSNNINRSTLAEIMRFYATATSIVTAPQMNITWGQDSQYWLLTNDSTIRSDVRNSEMVAELKNVSWLDVSATLTHVRSGIYVPQLVVVIPRPLHRSLHRVKVSAQISSENGAETKVSRELSDLVSNHVAIASFPWLVINLPVLFVGGSMGGDNLSTVIFRIQDHSGSWKSGLVIDSFQLVKFVPAPEVVTHSGERGSGIIGSIISSALNFFG